MIGSPSDDEGAFMQPFDIYVYTLTMACAITIYNHLYMDMPASIALSIVGVVISLAVALYSWYHGEIDSTIDTVIGAADFPDIMLHYMLGLLLFSGSLTTDVTELQSRWLDVFLISTVGVLISVAFVGTCVFLILENMHVFGSQPDAPDSTQVRDTASPLPGRHNTIAAYHNTH